MDGLQKDEKGATVSHSVFSALLHKQVFEEI